MSQKYNKHTEDKMMKSYVTGFILSIIFTIIPYLLVVNKTIGSTALLVAIFGFAFVQLLIQVTFFLHLGQGPKPDWNVYFFVSTVAIIVAVVGGSILIMNNLHYNMSPEDKVKKLVNDEGIAQIGGQLTGACKELGVNHQVTITNNEVDPLFVKAKKCDTLSIVNKGSQERTIIFRTGADNVAYAGETELTIRVGKSETLTLSETGQFNFLDQSQIGAVGGFEVK